MQAQAAELAAAIKAEEAELQLLQAQVGLLLTDIQRSVGHLARLLL